ncbi:uncharacterized protein PG998_010266 [Apiospora kogelbergensis]|uniref:uncharacterized protein n=1 Tax=Apiospora kogelbergensis TaxID=1337665 RepID=UPI00313168CF
MAGGAGDLLLRGATFMARDAHGLLAGCASGRNDVAFIDGAKRLRRLAVAAPVRERVAVNVGVAVEALVGSAFQGRTIAVGVVAGTPGAPLAVAEGLAASVGVVAALLVEAEVRETLVAVGRVRAALSPCVALARRGGVLGAFDEEGVSLLVVVMGGDWENDEDISVEVLDTRREEAVELVSVDVSLVDEAVEVLVVKPEEVEDVDALAVPDALAMEVTPILLLLVV